MGFVWYFREQYHFLWIIKNYIYYYIYLAYHLLTLYVVLGVAVSPLHLLSWWCTMLTNSIIKMRCYAFSHVSFSSHRYMNTDTLCQIGIAKNTDKFFLFPLATILIISFKKKKYIYIFCADIMIKGAIFLIFFNLFQYFHDIISHWCMLSGADNSLSRFLPLSLT